MFCKKIGALLGKLNQQIYESSAPHSRKRDMNPES